MVLTIMVRLREILNFRVVVAEQFKLFEKRLLEKFTAALHKSATASQQHQAATKRLEKQVDKTTRQLDQQMKLLDAKILDASQEVTQLRLVVQRLEASVSGRSEALRSGNLPMSISGDQTTQSIKTANESTSMSGDNHKPFSSTDILSIDQCPACGSKDSTPVCEYNKFIVLGTAPDEEFCRYDYSICHVCGICFASRRPIGERGRWLLANFETTIGRGAVKNPVLNPHPLTDDDRKELKRRASQGVFVSEHLDMNSGDYIAGALKDRLANSVHVEILTSLLSFKAPRVLEIRSRTGAVLAGLQRAWGADIYGMSIFESQQYLADVLYGIGNTELIDFENFIIPFDGRFDLIVCNHMFTHSIHPSEFLRTLHTHLKPGGYLYLYNEPDDDEFVKKNQSMLVTLNPLHLQAFDQSSLVRALGFNRFDAQFTSHAAGNHLCLLKSVDRPIKVHADSEAISRRLDGYKVARDLAVLRLPEVARGRFQDEWDAIVERCVTSGLADFDKKGHLRLVKADR